jgi:excisionase family DNA binding protein
MEKPMAAVTSTRREVLTLEEAARHLRLPENDVEELALQGAIPGRRVKREWRFLRVALDEWLRGPSDKARLLQQAGSLADDESLSQLRRSIYQRRGRSEANGVRA